MAVVYVLLVLLLVTYSFHQTLSVPVTSRNQRVDYRELCSKKFKSKVVGHAKLCRMLMKNVTLRNMTIQNNVTNVTKKPQDRHKNVESTPPVVTSSPHHRQQPTTAYLISTPPTPKVVEGFTIDTRKTEKQLPSIEKSMLKTILSTTKLLKPPITTAISKTTIDASTTETTTATTATNSTTVTAKAPTTRMRAIKTTKTNMVTVTPVTKTATKITTTNTATGITARTKPTEMTASTEIMKTETILDKIFVSTKMSFSRTKKSHLDIPVIVKNPKTMNYTQQEDNEKRTITFIDEPTKELKINKDSNMVASSSIAHAKPWFLKLISITVILLYYWL